MAQNFSDFKPGGFRSEEVRGRVAAFGQERSVT